MLVSRIVIAIIVLTSTLSANIAAQEKAKQQQCIASKNTDESGTWKDVRHQLKDGKAKCFESKCDITWQEYKEATCAKKIVKRTCVERNVKVVDGKVPC